jgi:hypothetical protein
MNSSAREPIACVFKETEGRQGGRERKLEKEK